MRFERKQHIDLNESSLCTATLKKKTGKVIHSLPVDNRKQEVSIFNGFVQTQAQCRMLIMGL